MSSPTPSSTHTDIQPMVEKAQPHVMDENPDPPAPGVGDEVFEAALVEYHALAATVDGEGCIYITAAPGDPANPRNWPNWKRYLIVILASFLNNLVCIGVSSYSTGVDQITAEFHVSSEIGTLGLTLFILGFAIGPLSLAPLSEFFGRRPVYLVSWALFTIFQLPLALAKNIETVLICRFIQGFVGSAPLANTGGVVHDIFSRDESGIAVAIYALSSTDGPPFGNVVGGFIAQQMGWRWLYWVQLIVFGAFWFIIYFFLPETRDTIIMMDKAHKVRHRTDNHRVWAKHEQDRASPGRLWKVSLLRPFKFLFTEPITYLSAGINALTFGIIFLANQAFPLIFGAGNGGHGWTHSGLINLTYFAFVLGSIIGFCLQPLQEAHYFRVKGRNGGVSVPEARFFSSLYGIWLLPIGLFIAAWSSYPNITFMGPLVGFTLFGVGFYQIICAILNYVVDGYGHYAASALGSVVMIRNLVACVFPLFSGQMYMKLGNQWATSLIAFLSLLLVPIPFFLYYHGKTARMKSEYCRDHFEDED